MAKYGYKGSTHHFEKKPDGPGVGGWIAIGFVCLILLGQCAG